MPGPTLFVQGVFARACFERTNNNVFLFSAIVCEAPRHTEISNPDRRKVGDINSLFAKEKYYIISGNASHRVDAHGGERRMKTVAVECVAVPGTARVEWRIWWAHEVFHTRAFSIYAQTPTHVH